jgi:hypothetical protein
VLARRASHPCLRKASRSRLRTCRSPANSVLNDLLFALFCWPDSTR